MFWNPTFFFELFFENFIPYHILWEFHTIYFKHIFFLFPNSFPNSSLSLPTQLYGLSRSLTTKMWKKSHWKTWSLICFDHLILIVQDVAVNFLQNWCQRALEGMIHGGNLSWRLVPWVAICISHTPHPLPQSCHDVAFPLCRIWSWLGNFDSCQFPLFLPTPQTESSFSPFPYSFHYSLLSGLLEVIAHILVSQ